MPKALDGIRVLDLTQYEAGPSCTQMLAWLGAEVIKIEPPDGRAGAHRAVRQARRGRVVLHAAELLQEGRDAQSEVAPRQGDVRGAGQDSSDVVVENMAPGVMDRLGLGYAHLKRLNPRLIHASVKGFAGGGPYADYKSFEWIAQAMAGAMSMTGSPDGPPTKAIGGLADTGAGLHTAIGILAAIIQRQATGVGQQIEVAQQDAVVNLLRIHLRETYVSGKPAPRQGNRSAAAAPSNIYRCSPGGAERLRVHPLRDPGDVDLADEDRRAARARRRSALRGPARSRAVHRRDRRHDRRRGRRSGPSTRCCRSWPAPASPAARSSTRPRSCPIRTCARPASSPTSSTRAAASTRCRATRCGCPTRPTDMVRSPLLGEHNAEVFGKLLGYDDAGIETLRRDGVI